MKRSAIALVLVATMLLQMIMPAVAQLGTPPQPPPSDGIEDRLDVGSVLANPLLFTILRSDEEKNPEKVFLRVDDLRFQATVGTTGSLNRVAQYQPLDTGTKVKNLYYQREYATQVFEMLGDYEGYNSSRLQANLSAPSRYHLEVFDNRVFHRLQDQPKVDFNLTPGANYERTWTRTRVEGDVSLSKGDEVALYGGLQIDKRNGNQAHSFYQLHRFNCTDCHTVSFGRVVGFRTDDWWGGARAKLGYQNAVLDARYRSSSFDNQGPVYTYNFGGPFGNSTLYPTSSSRDRVQQYRGYAGPGEGPWRAGANVVNLQRTNTTTGQTRNASYASVQAAGRVSDELSLTGSYYAQEENNSITTNLSNSRQRLTLQATYTPMKTLTLTGRGGFENREYRIFGSTAPQMNTGWFELRGDWRPTRQWMITGRYRNDNTDRPYFPTDLARRAQTEGKVTYSMPDLTLGAQYSHIYGSNAINDFAQTDFLAFMTARLAKKYYFNASYIDTTVDSNVAQDFFLPMPDGAGQLNPGIGGPLFLQSGLPYSAHNQYFQAGLTVPVGNPKNPINITPMYRWVRTDTTANYLPIFPAVPLDSRVNIVQSIYGVRVDVPVFGPNERLGVSWEHDRWRDAVNTSRSGSFDLFMINFSKKF